MKARIKILFMTILMVIISFPASLLVKAEVSQLTIDYLLAQTQDQWITMALAASGSSNLDLSYLDNFSGSSANDFSKTVLALTAASQNPYNYNGTDFIQGLSNYYQNNQIGSPSLLSDDFWAILALRSAGVEISDNIIQDSKNFILTNQNPDGGWSYAPGTESDTNDTAAAIMALLDAGLLSNNSQIQSAVSYLHAQQNPDGGFAFTEGGQSDSGSDAWVISAIYKLGDDPLTWIQGENNPLGHLESLGLADGSFKWIASDTQGNPLMTAYAAIALVAKFYPVSYYQPSSSDSQLHHLRIEGANNTYCDAEVEAANALEIVENGATVCGYTYEIEQTSWGSYLVAINNEVATGTFGWMYRVNWLSPMVGANDYILEEGDEVLWAYSEWGYQPLKISLSNDQVQLGEEVTVTVEYFNENDWLAANEATVYAGSQTLTTNPSGQVTVSFAEVGAYKIYAEKQNFIRSPRLSLVVGSGISQTVNMIVNIDNSTPTDYLSFIIDPTDLDFGTLRPGGNTLNNLTVINNGTVTFHLEAIVSGDSLFEGNTYLNESLWEDYSDNYGVNQSKEVEVDLRVPEDFNSSGQKNGSLIFWASRN
ncbi:DUF4430 domain-containing protein [Patescibacteria group bacterium]|nr:DUF4430 domain-containing protein [Patescibacteria group bacterium]